MQAGTRQQSHVYRNDNVAAKIRSFLWRERPWWEENDVIYFSVTSDGTTGPQWIERLASKKIWVRDSARSVLFLEGFKSTSGMITNVAVLKGMLFEGDSIHRTIEIRAVAETCGLTRPNPEVACLIGEKFSGAIQGMGIHHLVTMHEPIKGFDGKMLLLGVSSQDGSREFSA